ncbi:hypothetical protein J40TS1_14810 [Paenibacillus montaniterrae]|uniref:Copper amine oxidase-like N-terminal domain-containing protein n=1 Tax=Paenibacillus montaniterrae TaxID=429341 RepID=A0A919YPE3_9BACL|nr:TraB/GumN family protein [Paenibacillus montaniterrae]GIP15839.1 hypothetical protein J40TS1_14810 [Paenibacillus montaniterrae]
MKKWLTSLVAILLVFAIAIPVQAQSSGISVYYNGEKLDMTEPAFVEKGKTYVPLRSFFEELEYEVRYKSTKKQIILDWYGYESIIEVDTLKVIEFDEVVIEKLDLIYRNNTYYAPIRELEPVTVTTTRWDAATSSIYMEDDYSMLEPEEEHTPPEGFLWKVTKGEQTVYMLGSIHVGTYKMYPLRDEINKAYEASDIVVTEVDITKDPTEEEMKELEKLFTYQDGTTIKDHLSAEAYKALMELAKKLEIEGEDLEEFQTYQVWFINTMLSSGFDEGDADSVYGVDMHFLLQADEDELPIGELESFLQQYEMLAGFSPELQEQLLLETVMQYEYAFEGYEVGAGTDTLIDIWTTGDLEGLTEIAQSMKIASPEYYNALLTKRNAGMTDKIEQYLNDTQYKTYFVIAGALHFAGEDSIVAMLEKRGYKVERL